MKPTQILVLVAGTNNPSNSNILADAFIQGIQQQQNANVQKYLLNDMRINHFSLDFYDPQCSQEEDFCKLQKLLQEADGLVVATPIWNFSVPAHLKNFLDRMGSFALDETRSKGTLGGKPFYLIFTGGAPLIAWVTLMKKTTSHVAEALQYFGGSFIGQHFEPKCTKGKGIFDIVVDQRSESLASLCKQGFSFAQVVSTFAQTGKAPAGKRAKAKAMRWGEAILKKFG